MTPEEFAIARLKRSQTDAELASEFGVSVDVVRAWLAGSRKIPSRQAQLIEWHAASAERQAAVERAGIEECGWLKSFDTQPLPDRDEELVSHLKQFEDHIATCPTCQARDRFIRERFPPMPKTPQPLLLRTLVAWDDVVARFPKWVRTPLLILPVVIVGGGIGWAIHFAHGPLKIVMMGVLIVALLVMRFKR